MLMHIALLELRSPPTAQKLQSNAYMRTSLCVPEVIISRLQMPVYTRPVPPDSTGVEFPKYSLPDSLIIEQTWGRLFGRFETRKSPEALLIFQARFPAVIVNRSISCPTATSDQSNPEA